MAEHSSFGKMSRVVRETCRVWVEEARAVLRDEGLLIFFVLVPLLYPLAYSWIYNNELVRDVPVVVVDDSRSALSRRFVRLCDATPDVAVVAKATDIGTARQLLASQEAKAIYYLPSDFAVRVARGEQAVVNVYCDMGMMLNYKAAYQAALTVAQGMGAEIAVARAGNATAREDELTAQPLGVRDVAMFNPSGGYGSFILPAVLMLILQQTLALGMGLAAGTARERNAGGRIFVAGQGSPLVAVAGKALFHATAYVPVTFYLAFIVPRLFNFVTIGRPADLLAVLLPFMVASVFFAMAVSLVVRRREDVMLLVVFASVPLLFLSGVSWPRCAMPLVWEAVSWLFPSTFGIRAYVSVNTMGATAADVAAECRALWIQAAVYCAAVCVGYWRSARKSAADVAVEAVDAAVEADAGSH